MSCRKVIGCLGIDFCDDICALMDVDGNGCGRTLLVSQKQLVQAKDLIAQYKRGALPEMNDELWRAKKIVDSTLHPGMLDWSWSRVGVIRC